MTWLWLVLGAVAWLGIGFWLGMSFGKAAK